jgi:dipeptidyl aminopeptidase/acylaminoacyl peptidase
MFSVKKIPLYLFIIILVPLIFFIGRYSNKYIGSDSEGGSDIPDIEVERKKPLDIYTIESLSQLNINPGSFRIGKNIGQESSFASFLFTFSFEPNPEKNDRKKTSGQINIPIGTSKKPLIIMLRGYVDQEIYETGMGTSRASDVFARNGFITVAPDFLGYANSDKEAENIFESRFQTYITVASLINSLDQIDSWDKQNIFIWGHSNGGQVALTILEILKEDYPTALWAPVSRPFPYSILYYTDESEDRGKLIRSELAIFEEDYDVELYSLDNYLDDIKAPLLIHQGGNDDAVPISWTNDLDEKLTEFDVKHEYYVYPFADHNLRPNWDQVVARDIQFFQSNIKQSTIDN